MEDTNTNQTHLSHEPTLPQDYAWGKTGRGRPSTLYHVSYRWEASCRCWDPLWL